MDRQIKGLILACCSLGVSLLLAAPARAAQEQEAPAAAPPLQQLDEIVLNARRLEQRVLEAEERFYKLYNALNDRDDFDVSCDYYWTDDASLGLRALGYRRGCVPMFFVNAVAEDFESFGAPAYFSSGCGSLGWGHEFRGSSGWTGFSSIIGCSDVAALPRTASTRPRLMWLDQRARFAANLARVLQGNAELRAMANELSALAREGKEAQDNMAAARRMRAAERKCIRPNSPRAIIAVVCSS